MSKYGESIGIFHLTVANADLKLKPRKGDNYRLMDIVNNNQKDQKRFFGEMGKFIRDLIKRDEPPQNPNEEEELDMYVEFNIAELVKETMIAFRWATREKLEKIEKEELASQSKKLIDGN